MGGGASRVGLMTLTQVTRQPCPFCPPGRALTTPDPVGLPSEGDLLVLWVPGSVLTPLHGCRGPCLADHTAGCCEQGLLRGDGQVGVLGQHPGAQHPLARQCHTQWAGSEGSRLLASPEHLTAGFSRPDARQARAPAPSTRWTRKRFNNPHSNSGISHAESRKILLLWTAFPGFNSFTCLHVLM